MSRVTIPKSPSAAVKRLNTLDGLVTSTQWERAAIVWAFTFSAQGQRTDLSRVREKLSMSAFAKLGIHGLKKPDTIAAYRMKWESAMDLHGAADVQPGDTIKLPDVPWEDEEGYGRIDAAGKRRFVEKEPNAIGRVVNNMDELAVDVLAQNLSASTAEALVARIAEDRPGIVAEAVEANETAAHQVARNVLKNENSAVELMSDRKVRKNVSQAISDTYEDMHENVRRESGRQSADEHPAVLAGLRGSHNLNVCVRLLSGIRMTKSLRNELTVIVESARAACEAIEMASEVNGTVGEEVEAFLASLEGGE